MWELVVLYGITWAGAGGGRVETMPDKQTCYEVLERLSVTKGGRYVEGEKGEIVISYCRPKQDKQ